MATEYFASDMFETESKRPDLTNEGWERRGGTVPVARPLMKPIASQMSLHAVIPAVYIARCLAVVVARHTR